MQSLQPHLRISISSIKKKIDQLEWKIMTTPMDLETENEIIKEIARLERILSSAQAARQVKQELIEFKAEIARLRVEISDVARELEEVRGKIRDIATRKQSLREEINKISNEINKLSEEIKGLQEKIDKINKEIDIRKSELKDLYSKLSEIRSMRRKAREEAALKEIKKRAEDKLRMGERLTLEELRALYGVLENEE